MCEHVHFQHAILQLSAEQAYDGQYVQCTVLIWRKVSFVYILKCIQNAVKYKMQIASTEKYTGVSAVDCNMVSFKMFDDIIFVLLLENNLDNWACINW